MCAPRGRTFRLRLLARPSYLIHRGQLTILAPPSPHHQLHLYEKRTPGPSQHTQPSLFLWPCLMSDICLTPPSTESGLGLGLGLALISSFFFRESKLCCLLFLIEQSRSGQERQPRLTTGKGTTSWVIGHVMPAIYLHRLRIGGKRATPLPPSSLSRSASLSILPHLARHTENQVT